MWAEWIMKVKIVYSWGEGGDYKMEGSVFIVMMSRNPKGPRI